MAGLWLSFIPKIEPKDSLLSGFRATRGLLLAILVKFSSKKLSQENQEVTQQHPFEYAVIKSPHLDLVISVYLLVSNTKCMSYSHYQRTPLFDDRYGEIQYKNH